MTAEDRFNDDEIVSAVLDGEASPEEVQRVASDPELSARLELLRQVSGAVGEPVEPLDELSRRRLIDRALDAADPLPGISGSTPRAARRGRFGRANLLGAAAALALLALAGGVVASLGSDGADHGDMAALDSSEGEVETFYTTSGGLADEADDAGGDGASPMADDDLDMGPVPESTARSSGADVGDHSTVAEFVAAARTALAVAPTTSTRPIEADEPDTGYAAALEAACGVATRDAMALVGGSRVTIVSGTIAERPVAGLVGDDPDSSVAIVDLVDCSVTIVD